MTISLARKKAEQTAYHLRERCYKIQAIKKTRRDNMAKILKGADVVSALGEKMKIEVANLEKNGITPTLATLRVGEKADDISY